MVDKRSVPLRIARSRGPEVPGSSLPGERAEDNWVWGNVRELAPERTVLVKRTLRSGQRVYYAGNAVIMGDVNPGAEIVAGGSIVVLGRLRGMAHAGANGSEEEFVAAFRLKPTQLRIAGHVTRPPEGEEWDPVEPEVARIVNGVVVIDRY